MLNTLMAIVLAAVMIPARQVDSKTVRIYIVNSPGETMIASKFPAIQSDIERGLQFWSDLAPDHPTFEIIGLTPIDRTEDVFHTLSWSVEYASDADLTVFVIANEQSRRLLFDDAAGEAQEFYRFAFAVEYGFPGANGFPATIAHESGHVLYSLPDLYRHCGTCPPDIMRWPVPAFDLYFIGCESLATLGSPCKTVSLPIIVT